MTGIDPSMFELFREEVRTHSDTLSYGLLELEADPGNPQRIEPLMRAAHSLKGAARIVGIELAVRLAHSLEDAFVAAQSGKVRFAATEIDQLLAGADVLSGLGQLPDAGAIADWELRQAARVNRLEPVYQALAGGTPASTSPQPMIMATRPAPSISPPSEVMAGVTADRGPEVFTAVVDLPPPPVHDPISIPVEPIPLDSGFGMYDLFREEIRAHLLVVSAGLGGDGPFPTHMTDDLFESLRQIRGSARVMKCGPVEVTATTLAEFLTATRDGRVVPTPAAASWLRFAVATLAGLIRTDEADFPQWLASASAPLDQIATTLRNAVEAAPRPPVAGRAKAPTTDPPSPHAAPVAAPSEARPAPLSPPPVVVTQSSGETIVRVTAQSLSRLMGLAGESLVQARWLHLFSNALVRLKKQHEHLATMLDGVLQTAAAGAAADHIAQLVAESRRQAATCREELTDQTIDFDDHAARAEDLNSRLYREVIASRMRPFRDGVHGLARVVRDMARGLGKQARLVIAGENTDVDRDILEKLEAPLNHLIRNAVDHGIEPPAERIAAGKPEVGTVRVEARHRAGMLSVVVADDGRGVDCERLRRKVVERGLNSPDLVRLMADTELMEFLFLPGFTTATVVTEFSGRGVGLDVVQDAVRRVGGGVRVTTTPGRGATFHLQLPITLSVIRAVVVEVGGEPYAFPHTRIDRLLRVPRDTIRSLEHRHFVTVDGQNIGLVVAAQLLDVPSSTPKGVDLPVLLLSDSTGVYGLVVDAFRGEQDLVVRPLDPRLGKVPNLSAAAVLDDGEPVLIVDVEDLVRSMDQFIQTGSLRRCEVRQKGAVRKKRVLVADDSITVREVERQLLGNQGYEVNVAVDGVDGWNQIRGGQYDLLVTDVDMPRMTGLQLVQAVRADDKLKNMPVIIVSYKERDEDRRRGMEVGANAYLTKSSFHDNRFVRTVEELIGQA
jgi:two-component system sensor histidine kinase and response regulator WspE